MIKGHRVFILANGSYFIDFFIGIPPPKFEEKTRMNCVLEITLHLLYSTGDQGHRVD